MLRVLIGLMLLFSFPSVVRAAIDASGVGVDLESGEAYVPGSLVCFNGDVYGLCNEEYSENFYGVVAETPALTIRAADKESSFIVSEGTARVLVTAANGSIETGDLLTTSTAPGVAQKATKNGFVIGRAEEPYTGDGQGEVLVTLQFQNASFSDSNLIRDLSSHLTESPTTGIATLRYFLAVFTILMSLSLALVYFIRMFTHTMEQIGRNPNASTKIYLSLFFSSIVLLSIVALGLGLAYLILVI